MAGNLFIRRSVAALQIALLSPTGAPGEIALGTATLLLQAGGASAQSTAAGQQCFSQWREMSKSSDRKIAAEDRSTVYSVLVEAAMRAPEAMAHIDE